MTTTAPSPSPTAGPRLGRSWLQFRLGSLIVVMVLCALGVTWWRQWKLSQELAQQEAELRWIQTQVEMLDAIHRVVRSIDLKNPEHVRLKQEVEGFSPFFNSVLRRRMPYEEFKVILFQSERVRIPGSNTVVAVILTEDRIIDHLIYTSSTSEESCDSTLVEAKGDGNSNVVIQGERGYLYGRNVEPFQIAYAVTRDGFGPEVKDMAAPKVAVEN